MASGHCIDALKMLSVETFPLYRGENVAVSKNTAAAESAIVKPSHIIHQDWTRGQILAAGK